MKLNRLGLTALAACAALGASTVLLRSALGGSTNADQGNTSEPKLTPPDPSVVLPKSLDSDAQAAFDKGFAYYLWPAQEGPVRFHCSDTLAKLPVFCLSKAKPIPYRTAVTLVYQTDAITVADDPQLTSSAEYGPRGRVDIPYFDFTGMRRVKVGLSDATKARIHLVDRETGRTQISNEITLDIKCYWKGAQ